MFECRRSPRDISIIKDANLDKDQLLDWIDTLFKELDISGDYFKWFKQVVLENYDKVTTKEIRELMLWKIIHTKETVLAGLDILNKLDHLNLDKNLVTECLFLHDIGRFNQCLLGTYTDHISFDHGDYGASLYKEKFSNDIIYKAIKEHNKYTYLTDIPYVHLTRDADKLAIMRVIFCKFSSDSLDNSNITVSAEVKEAYYSKKLVDNHFTKNRLDILVKVLSFEFDFYFKETKDIYISDGLKSELESFIRGFDPTF